MTKDRQRSRSRVQAQRTRSRDARVKSLFFAVFRLPISRPCCCLYSLPLRAVVQTQPHSQSGTVLLQIQISQAAVGNRPRNLRIPRSAVRIKLRSWCRLIEEYNKTFRPKYATKTENFWVKVRVPGVPIDSSTFCTLQESFIRCA